jgi:EAL domain-containing protein (putative c-di-GMP-specific phosphodiesterase class I)
MYEAKRTGRDAVVYAEHLGARALARTEGEERLRQAIEGGELLAHYQPILDDGQVVAVEALARWQHPERGLLTPGAFLEDARHAGLLSQLGEAMLREACAQTARWNRGRLRPLRVQVNVAEQQLLDAAFPGMVAAIVAETGLEPQLLTLEISEDVALERLGADLTVLRELRALGVTLSVDDFGLGRSTFAALRALDMVSELKIDRSFISGIDASSTDQALVRAMVALAGEVGLHVVAEGVETPAELREVSRLGVRCVQGFHLARPAAAADVEVLLEPRPKAA